MNAIAPVPGKRNMRLFALIAALALAALAATAAEAPARTIQPYEYVESFDGADADGGKFLHVDRVALDQHGHLAVADAANNNGRVILFDEDGHAVDFADTGGTNLPISPGPGFSNEARTELAFDETSGPGQGRLYLAGTSWEELLHGYTAGGTPLGAPWPLCGAFCGNALWGEVAGLKVAPDGRIWVINRGSLGVAGDSENGLWALNADGALDQAFAPMASAFGLPVVGAFDSAGNLVYGTEESAAFGGRYAEVRKVTDEMEPIAEGFAPGPGKAIDVDRSTDWTYVNQGSSVEVLDTAGNLIDTFGGADGPYAGMLNSVGIAVRDSDGRAYVANERAQTVDIFERGAPVVVPTVGSNPAASTANSATISGTVDPDGGGDTTACYFKYGSKPDAMTSTANCAEGQVLPSAGGPQAVTAALAGLFKGNRYFYRLYSDNASNNPQASPLRSFAAANAPVVAGVAVTNVNTNTAEIEGSINPEGDWTSYRVLYGTSADELDLESGVERTSGNLTVGEFGITLTGLTPDQTYYYRVVAENEAGEDASTIKSFTTFDFEAVLNDECGNALARQQTGASMLLDCRAYELVSAADTGGFNVSSDLAAGQGPYPGFPEAEDAAVYSVEGGAIPVAGNPTNRGPDPYVSRRGAEGWTTSYVGIPADVNDLTGPFASRLTAASADLGTAAFAGEDLCDPCFADGSVGIPVRRGGVLTQGMAGSIPVAHPVPAGEIREPLSDDGSHLVFGAEQRFEPEGHDGALTIYLRDLDAGATEVASTAADGSTLTGTVAALDIAADGSRVLIGRQVGSDDAGNRLYDLFMHFAGQEDSTPIAATATGVRFNGMSADGGAVYFSTADQVGLDTDSGADLFRADVDAAISTVTRISPGDSDACNPASQWNSPDGEVDCGVLAVAGGGGVSADGGTAFFLSPEVLADDAVADQPNLYAAAGGAPELVATLEVDNPLVENARESADERSTADFEVSADGSAAVFASGLSLTGFETRGYSQVYRYDTQAGELACASCAPTNAPSRGDARLAANGSSLSEDGRVFFTTGDALALRDSNQLDDVYEWTPGDGGTVELISTGIDADDSSLLTVTADGTDVFFFTRETLTVDGAGGRLAKLYTAREDGGFFIVPPSPPCAAADECRGPGTVAAPPKPISTVAADPEVPRDCSPIADRVRRQQRQARRLSRRARRADGARARKLRAKAGKAKRNAKKRRAALRDCRRSGGVG